MGSVSQEGNVSHVNDRGAGDSIEVSPGYGFEVGDMVWGKVKSHPWWPAHVYSEELVTPSVRRSKKDGLLLVAFFGDSSYGWFDSSELTPFDSNFAEKSIQTNSRTFVKALEEAMDEVRRRSALGLSCMCRNKLNFRKTDAQGYFAVDVVDYEPGAVYSINTIGKARESFQPKLALDFVRELALEPTDEHDDIDFIKNKAILMSYRRAVYKEFDEPYDQAFDGDLVRPLPGSIRVSTSGKKPSKAPLSGRQVFGDTANAKLNKPKDHAIVKTDKKYLFKRRQEPKIQKVKESTLADIEDPILATLKVSESSNNPPPDLDLEINTPIISLIHKSSNLHKFLTQNGIPSSQPHKISSSEMKIKKRKKESLMEKVSSNIQDPHKNKVEKKKKRKKESLMHDCDDDGDGDTPQMELPRVLEDLHSFALDPFHTNNNRKLRSKVRQVFLKFRSLVFQKSLNGSKSPLTGAPPPPPGSLDDPTKGGIKRDRDEETAAKKKKIKNSTKKIDEDGGRQTVVVKPRKSGQEVGQRAARAEEEEPTTLKMEFPSGESLPSISELKAKLGRYGTMDHDGTRIYWKTFTCLVVYKYKADALAALKAVTGSCCNLFGNTNVKYSLKEVSNSKPPSDRQLAVEEDRAAVDTPVKSCLKKSGGEEGGRKISRVKFNLAQSTLPSPPPPPPPLASPPPPRSSMNYRKPSAPPSLPPKSMLVAPPPPPLVPLQPAPRLNRPATIPPPPPPNIDIAQQMVSLLTRCNDVVAHVTGILGYVPYHPL